MAVRPGIIPARAGFTLVWPPGSRGAGDHPRSRGVYCGRHCTLRRVVGSSPLARGLRAEHDDRHLRERIIPARAGFTRPPPRRARAPRDHPRSRGVYAHGGFLRGLGGGSSPLARGLPRLFSGAGHLPRIIPARAGFTGWLVDSSGPGLGSSPLARGLPVPTALKDCGWRIIPARAGFTWRSVSALP